MAPRPFLARVGPAALLALALIVAPARAQELRVAPQQAFGVPPADTDVQTFPEPFALASAGSGFVAAWWNQQDDSQIQVRRLTADGAPDGAISALNAYQVWDLRLADDGRGGAALLFEMPSDDENSLADRIAVRRVGANGALGTGGVVEPAGYLGDVRSQPDGSLLVAFAGDDDGKGFGASSAMVRRVAPDGTIGPRVRIGGPGHAYTGGPSRVALAARPGGSGALAVWAESTPDYLVTDIYARPLAADGTPAGPIVKVSQSEPSALQPDLEDGPADPVGATRPAVAYAPAAGQYLASWVSDDASVGGPQILARRLDASGALADAAPLEVTPRQAAVEAGLALAPELADDPGSGAWILARLPAFRASYFDWDYQHVLARRMPYANPLSGGPEVRVDDPVAGVGPPALASGPAGTLIAWNPEQPPRLGPVASRVGTGPDPGRASLSGAPSGVSASREADLIVSSSRADAHLECRADGGSWQACTSPWAARGLRDGIHRVAVRSVGPEGWVEPGDGAQASWRVEAAPPKTTFTQVPSSTTRFARAWFTADEAATFECRFDGGAWRGCSMYDGASATLPDGPHRVEVRATDDAGRREATPARYDWTIDTHVPETMIVDGPRGITVDDWGTFTFSSDEPGATFECADTAGTWVACRSGDRIQGRRGALSVRARDAAGNVDGTPAVWKWTVQASPPVAYLTLAINQFIPDAPTIRVEHTDGATVECRLDGGPWSPCDLWLQPYDLALGDHLAEARATDDLGRVSAIARLTFTVRSWRLDAPLFREAALAEPDTTITSGPPPRTHSASATFTFTSSDPGAHFECDVSWDPIPCSGGTLTIPSTYDGDHWLRVVAVSADGTRDSTPAIWNWHVNAQPPETYLTGLPASRAERAAFYWESDDGDEVASSECRLDGGDWFGCPDPVELTVSDGPHHFEVRNVDVDGQVDPTPEVYDWIADPITPGVTITSSPRFDTTATDATVTFTVDRAAATAECRLDAGAWAACADSVTYTGLAEGDHRVQVRASNQGRLSAVRETRWRIDLTPPDTQIDADPLAEGMRTTRTAIEISVLMRDDGRPWTEDFRYEPTSLEADCRLDGGPWGRCTDGIVYSALADGPHVIEARAFDEAGNVDPTPARFTWTVGVPVPDTVIADGPASPSGSRTARFSLGASGELDGYECRLDDGAWDACPADLVVSDVRDGAHRLEARALFASRADATPAAWDWTVEAPPAVSIASGPGPIVATPSPSFAVSSDDAAARLECRVDGGAWTACASPVSVGPLADGQHRFEARAIDAAGLIGQAGPWAWSIDSVAPDTYLDGAPPALSRFNDVRLGLRASEPDADFECRLDGAAYARCPNPWHPLNLSEGDHVADVRAIDVAGTPDPTPVTVRWRVDTVRPGVTIRFVQPQPPTGFTVDVASPDPAATMLCRLDDEPDWRPCGAGYARPDAAYGDHHLRARATDPAGNISIDAATWFQQTQGGTPTPTPTATPTPTPSPSPTPTPTSSPTPTATPTPTSSPTPTATPPDEDPPIIIYPAARAVDVGPPLVRPAPTPAADLAASLVKRLGAMRPGRVARVRIAVPGAGRLTVRLLDASKHTTARAAATYSRAGNKILRLKPQRRPRAVRVSWNGVTAQSRPPPKRTRVR